MIFSDLDTLILVKLTGDIEFVFFSMNKLINVRINHFAYSNANRA